MQPAAGAWLRSVDTCTRQEVDNCNRLHRRRRASVAQICVAAAHNPSAGRAACSDSSSSRSIYRSRELSFCCPQLLQAIIYLP